MYFQSTFRIHLADPLGLVDIPLIITSAYTNAAGLPRAEWFLVIPENKGILFSQRNKLDLGSFPEGRIKFDEEFMLNEALDQAKLRLRRYILENRGSDAPSLLARATGVQVSDINHLARLWMRGSCCGCLSEMRAKSECAVLVDTLVWIHGLPMLATQDL